MLSSRRVRTKGELLTSSTKPVDSTVKSLLRRASTKFLPGDQIWRINGEDVKNAPRDHVIQPVRACKETVSLSVCQPPLDNSARKSALLSAAKKAKLKTNPSRVRFAEGVVINGAPPLPLSQSAARDSSEPVGPLMPNVLKVYLENGPSRSSTTRLPPCRTY